MNQKSSGNEDVKGFNDSELEDIMNEIEHLEKEFVEGNSDPSLTKASDISKEEVKTEKLTELKEERDLLIDSTGPLEQENVVGLVSSPSLHSAPLAIEDTCQTSFDLKVQGNIGLSMSFSVGEQVISLRVEDHGLHIELGNGAKFSIPLDEFKKSA